MFAAPLLLVLASAAPVPPMAPVPPSQIEVSGKGKVATPPEIATIAYTVRGEGATSDDAVRTVEADRKAIAQAVSQITQAEFNDGELSIQPVRGLDCKEEFASVVLSKDACAVAGFVASMSVTAHIASVKDAATVVGLIGRLKGFQPSVESFGIKDEPSARSAALAAAVKDARASAEVLALANGARIGRLISMTTVPRMESDNRSYLTIRQEPPPPPAVLAPVKVNITPAPIETEATVTATYELLP
ncbi:MAG: SIMPL domain-containing protein [Novosphingobium sp.]|uniref:SIMPL domain-containing protein n=1 Tax=Novosphingobium sp. TaxID=1874826 RepID=UPI003016FA78